MRLRFGDLPAVPELRQRSEALRARVLERAPYRGAEFYLQHQLVERQAQLLPEHPWLVAFEWEVTPGFTQRGKGDLVFSDSVGNLVVVETKWLREGPGKQTRTKRNAGRVKVREQARRYAQELWRLVPWAKSVEARVWTNEEDGPRMVGRFPAEDHPSSMEPGRL